MQLNSYNQSSYYGSSFTGSSYYRPIVTDTEPPRTGGIGDSYEFSYYNNKLKIERATRELDDQDLLDLVGIIVLSGILD